MFKQIITDVIGQQLGNYIQGFDSDSFGLDLRGNVRLKNLRIKADALSELQLPIRVKHGFVGSLHIVFPFGSIAGLGKDPVVVNLEDVHLVAGLVREFDGQEHMAGVRKAKQNDILADQVKERAARELEQARRAAGDRGKRSEDEASDEGGFEAYKNSVINTIVDNIQINVKSVHLRLEDDFTPSRPFSIGVTLSSVQLRTCDRSWQPMHKNVTRGEDGKINTTNRRLLLVESLAVYWNGESAGTRWEVDLSHDSLVADFRRMIETAHDFRVHRVGFCQTHQHDYVLAPTSFEAKLTVREPRAAKSGKTPELEVHAELGDLSLRFDEGQYRALINLAYFGTYYELCKKYQARADLRRPATRPKRGTQPEARPCPSATATLWWRYALGCIRVDLHERRGYLMSSSFLMTKLKQRRLYIALVKHTRHAAWRPPLCRQNAVAIEAERNGFVRRRAQFEEHGSEVMAIQRLWRGHRVRGIIEETRAAALEAAALEERSEELSRRSTAGGGLSERSRSTRPAAPRKEVIAGWVRRRLHTAEARRAATHAVVIQRRWRGHCERRTARRFSIDRRLAAFGGSGGSGGGGGGGGGGDDASVMESPRSVATPRTPRSPVFPQGGSDAAGTKAAAAAAKRASVQARRQHEQEQKELLLQLQHLEDALSTAHILHWRRVAELQLSWEESLLVDEFGGERAWHERLKPKSRVQSGVTQAASILGALTGGGGEHRLGTLTVTLQCAVGLLSKDFEGASDPYCECYLTPWGRTQQAYRTEVVYNDADPWWGESTTLAVTAEDQVLHIVVYDHNKFMRTDVIGELMVPVATIAHSSRQYADVDWPHNLCPTAADAKKGINSPGVLHMSLVFTPTPPPKPLSPPPPATTFAGAEGLLGSKMTRTLLGAFGGDSSGGGSPPRGGGSGAGANTPPSPRSPPQPSLEAAEAEMPLSPGWRTLGASSSNLLRAQAAAAAYSASASASASVSASSAQGASTRFRPRPGLLERGESLRGDTLQRHRRQSALQRGQSGELAATVFGRQHFSGPARPAWCARAFMRMQISPPYDVAIVTGKMVRHLARHGGHRSKAAAAAAAASGPLGGGSAAAEDSGALRDRILRLHHELTQEGGEAFDDLHVVERAAVAAECRAAEGKEGADGAGAGAESSTASVHRPSVPGTPGATAAAAAAAAAAKKDPRLERLVEKRVTLRLGQARAQLSLDRCAEVSERLLRFDGPVQR